MLTANITALHTPEGMTAVEGARPLVNAKGVMIGPGRVARIYTGRGMFVGNQRVQVNSQLLKDEWEMLDSAIVPEAVSRLGGIQYFLGRGLTHPLGSIGILLSQYNTASEMTGAAVTLDGHSRGSRDRQDYKLNSVPVPIVHKEFSLGARELEASRLAGNPIDTAHAAAAGRVTAEKPENMLFNGDTSVVLNGNSISGLTTHTNRNTSSGSDWGTATNVSGNVTTMINGLVADNYFGPYVLFVSATQYIQISTTYYSDGSSDTPLDRILRLPQIEAVIPSDWLTDEAVLVQPSRDVIDIAFVPGFGVSVAGDLVTVTGVTTLEWASGDGMMSYFKTVAIIIPRVKATYSGRSGIYHMTGI